MQSTAVADAARSLPIGNTVREIMQVAWSGIGRWAVVALIALVLQCAIVFLLIPAILGGSVQGSSWWTSRAAQVITALLYIAPATAWIRGVVAGNPPSGLQFRWGARELMYILRELQLGIFLGVLILLAAGLAIGVAKIVFLATGGSGEEAAGQMPSLLAGISLEVLAVGLVGLIMWLSADFLMMLPAAANGDESTFRVSADLTRHHRWQIVGIGLITSAIVLLVLLLISVIFAWLIYLLLPAGGRNPEYVAAADAVIVPWFATLVHATGLGCVYRRLSRPGESSLTQPLPSLGKPALSV